MGFGINDILVGNEARINEVDIWTENTESIDNINGDIKFDSVNFSYPSRKEASVLHNLSLIARAGQTTALVGSSGCGKSTCISLLLRYYEPSSNRITINGRAITDYNIKHLRQNIGVVSQEPIVFGVSIYENIRFGKVNATQAEIEQAAQQANAHDFIMQLPNKYETIVGERGILLSGGEKQRIALARALVKQPTILLLDEATSALDIVSEKIVQEALNRACEDRTAIVVAHRLTTIQNAHQIYVLDNGTVIEQGTHETLMATQDGKYQAMVKLQQIEKIDDDMDNMISIEKPVEEDKKPIFEQSRLLSDSKIVDVEKGFQYCSIPTQRHQVLINSLLVLLLGVILLVLRFIQHAAFAISGSKLTQRICSKFFACLLHQEIAYFDRPENSSGAISVRLSSDASAIRDMIGARLGFICEAIALWVFGTLLGCFVSWQLTMITFCPLFILVSILYANMSINMRLNKKPDQIIVSTGINSSVAAAEAFFDLFDRKPVIDNISNEGQDLVDFRGEIQFDQVKFIYPTRPRSIILNEFQLNIKPGQRVALVGASGCGKSTTIQLLERFYDVTSGQIKTLISLCHDRRASLAEILQIVGLRLDLHDYAGYNLPKEILQQATHLILRQRQPKYIINMLNAMKEDSGV
ncbi:unnamed protein product [Rotaria sp. Silwood1]|nr:unnamed protein product [Rotaria sp. Silwood1]